MKERKLFIRTDANTTMATGHMMRCLSIADAAKGLGVETVFIVTSAESGNMPLSRGYEIINLDRQWDDFQGEIPVISDIIARLNIECILVDSYWVSKEYMKAISSLTKTAYIDDLHETIWPCGVLINYAVYCDLFDYEHEYPDSVRLLGSDYMPLRQEYMSVRDRVVGDTKEILVVTGGSDELHFMLNTVSAVLAADDLSSMHFTFVCGRFNTDIDELMRLGDKADNISIYPSLPTLKESMENADILVSAGGTTLYEMAATGLPGIIFRMADNQKNNVDAFAKMELIVDAGDIRYNFSYDELLNMIRELARDRAMRNEMSDRLKNLVDGRGAERIVKGLFDIG